MDSTPLKKARKLFETPSSWTQNAYAKDSRGLCVDPASDGATCFCMAGAIRACGGDTDHIRAVALTINTVERFSIRDDTEGVVLIWNDEWNRTLDDVTRVLDQTIGRLEAETA